MSESRRQRRWMHTRPYPGTGDTESAGAAAKPPLPRQSLHRKEGQSGRATIGTRGAKAVAGKRPTIANRLQYQDGINRAARADAAPAAAF